MFNAEEIMQERFKRSKTQRFNRLLAWFIRILLHEKQFKEFAAKYPNLRGIDSVEQILSHFQIRCEIDMSELENIPTKGAVVLVANHPIGSLDALALLKTVAAVRPDVKIVANQLLSYLEPLNGLFVVVKNMDAEAASKSQIKNLQAHLANQGALIVFPSGEVSRFGIKGVRDKRWNKGFIRLAARSRSPIVPIHIEGRNSAFFYLVSAIRKSFAFYLLVHEMFKQRGKRLEIRIGKSVSYQTWHDGKTPPRELARRFRRHVYMIGKGRSGCLHGEAPIALPVADRAALKAAVESSEYLGEMSDSKTIWLYRRADDDKSAPILHELGRLREAAFRAVGEGSGCRLDLDRYDDYYYHLILWDPHRLEIAGAYRFIPAACRLERDGIKSLYSSALFDYSQEMNEIFENGVELGRSFIQPIYWGKRGLDYLWHGIGAYLAQNPQCRYLFGPVSISGAMPVVAKDLLVSFYRLYFAAPRPIAVSKRPYQASSPSALENFSGDNYYEDFRRLKNMLSNMNCNVPTLYKQYSELCETGGVQFADFGYDPEFNNCIDGLIIVDTSKLKPVRYERYVAPYLSKRSG
jgi:putative hemolysin